MRKLIAGMKISLDGKFEGPGGHPDWVETWSEEYELTPQIDACLLGAGMYPGYESYWSAMQSEPEKPLPMTGKLPSPAELEWARFAGKTPHYVLSSTLSSARWPQTSFVRGLEDVAALKRQRGRSIYLVGGARTIASLIEAGLVDELRLIAYPVISGEGKPLFPSLERRRGLELRNARPLVGGRLSLSYGIA
jgi:dihydrofolate reductase